jgi:hypothetical protein
MALSARVPAAADTAGFVPELWQQKTVDEVEKILVAMDAVDFQGFKIGLKMGDTINIPVFNNVTATEVVVGTKASSTDIATGSEIQLVMNQWYETPIDVDDMTMKQSQVDWPSKARSKAAYSIRVQIDTSVCTLFQSLNGSSVYGSDGQPLDDDIMLYLMETLTESDVPLDNGRSLVTDPSGLIDILKIDKFLSDQYGKKGAVVNGIIGQSVYACTVRITNNLVATTTGSYGVMLHKDAIAGCVQIETPWTKKFEELHNTRFQHEALWGVKELRDSFGIPFYTRKK